VTAQINDRVRHLAYPDTYGSIVADNNHNLPDVVRVLWDRREPVPGQPSGVTNTHIENLEVVESGLDLAPTPIGVPAPVSATWVRVLIEVEPGKELDKKDASEGLNEPLADFWSAETYALALGLDYNDPQHIVNEFMLLEGAVIVVEDDQGRRSEVKFR
jgi:hypothetical protein